MFLPPRSNHRREFGSTERGNYKTWFWFLGFGHIIHLKKEDTVLDQSLQQMNLKGMDEANQWFNMEIFSIIAGLWLRPCDEGLAMSDCSRVFEIICWLLWCKHHVLYHVHWSKPILVPSHLVCELRLIWIRGVRKLVVYLCPNQRSLWGLSQGSTNQPTPSICWKHLYKFSHAFQLN